MSSSIEKFPFNRWIIFIPVMIILISFPAMSAIELITTGEIDLNAVTPTRRQTPIWLIYLLSWLFFLPTLPIVFAPVIKYTLRGYVFKLDADFLFIDKIKIHHSEIEEIEETSRGVRISTPQGTYFFHPRMSSGGYEAFEGYRNRHGLK